MMSCNRKGDWHEAIHAPFMEIDERYADSILLSLTIDEKIGQLMILRSSTTEQCYEDSLYNWARDGKISGMILENLELNEYIRYVDNCRTMTRLPLLNGTTQQVSLNNQFSDAVHFPTPATISSIASDSVRQVLNDLYIQQCKALDIQFSFAPNINLADTLFNNPTIFEQDREAMIHASSKKLDQLQKENILAIGTEFNDFHFIENDTLGILDSMLNRYQNLTYNGISGWKVSNEIYQIDTLDKLFPGFIQDYLYDNMDFGGLIISEVTSPSAVKNVLRAGTDLMIVNGNPQTMIDSLNVYIDQGLLTIDALDQKVKKILMAKIWSEADQSASIESEWATQLIRFPSYENIVQDLYEQSIVLAHNNDLLPFSNTYNRYFRLMQYGATDLKYLKKQMAHYASFSGNLFESNSQNPLQVVDLEASSYATNIITLDDLILDGSVHQDFIQSVNTLSKVSKVLVVNFGNPLNLRFFEKEVNSIQIPENNKWTQNYVGSMLFGGRSAFGKLPIDVAQHLPYGTSNTSNITRLAYVDPSEVGIAPEKLVGIDAIARSAISKKVFPGCQVLIAKEGKVIYNKSFGHHTYDQKNAIGNNELYDLASLTKVAATTLGIMKLAEQGKINLDDKIVDVLDMPSDTRLRYVTIRQLLLHRSKIQANMPIRDFVHNKESLLNGCNEMYCNKKQGNYTLQVAENIFMRKDWVDSLYTQVYDIKPYKTRKYRYSDVNFNLLQKIIEKKSGLKLDEYVYSNFYNPLNLKRLLYNPRQKYGLSEIPPTAEDDEWRNQLVHGYVHDESAAIQGGVAGNAGLFGNAEDLAILMQMLLNGGRYGDKQYLRSSTIDNFSKRQRHSYRGLGFDKPRGTKYPSYSRKSSRDSYGHTGFTGTAAWVDPKEEIVYIFLTNRIYPDVDNRKLFKEKVRYRIHNVLYNALDSYEQKFPSLDPPPVSNKSSISKTKEENDIIVRADM